MSVELIRSADRFNELRDEWSELLGDSSAESPFLTWEWLNAWWSHLGGSRRLALLTVRERGRLMAVVPLCAARGRLPFLWRHELMGTGFAGSDYLDAIVRRRHELGVVHALAEYVGEQAIALHLVRLPEGSWLARMSAPLGRKGWSLIPAADGFCPFIRLTGHTWDSFLATIGPAHRATTRRRLRQLERSFEMRFEPVASASDTRTALEKLFAFHDARFGSRGTAFHTETLRGFHLDVAERLRASGLLRLFTLRLNGDLAAVMYGMAFKRRFYFYQHGYDPQFLSHGVGRAILDLSIRAAIDEGLDQFDLLYGGEAYKSAWTSEKRSLTRLDAYPAHLGGRVHRRAVDTERTLRAFARRVISSAHVPQTS